MENANRAVNIYCPLTEERYQVKYHFRTIEYLNVSGSDSGLEELNDGRLRYRQERV